MSSKKENRVSLLDISLKFLSNWEKMLRKFLLRTHVCLPLCSLVAIKIRRLDNLLTAVGGKTRFNRRFQNINRRKSLTFAVFEYRFPNFPSRFCEKLTNCRNAWVLRDASKFRSIRGSPEASANSAR